MPIRNFDMVALNIKGEVIGSHFLLSKEEIEGILDSKEFTDEQKVKCFKDLIGPNSKVITTGGQAAVWLYSNWDDEGTFLNGQLNPNVITDDEKFARGMLAFKLNKGGDQEYSKAELDLLKNVVGKRGSVHFVFQLRNYLLETEAADLKALKETDNPKE